LLLMVRRRFNGIMNVTNNGLMKLKMRVQSKQAIETDKPDVSQEENKSSGEMEEANARAAKEAS
jgi:hypothetical protein